MPSCAESRRHDPFIDLRFFRSIPFASATVTAVCVFAAWGAFLFMMSLYLQGQRGYSAAQTGLIYLPIAIGALFFSPLSGGWSAGSGPARRCWCRGC